MKNILSTYYFKYVWYMFFFRDLLGASPQRAHRSMPHGGTPGQYMDPGPEAPPVQCGARTAYPEGQFKATGKTTGST